MKKKIILFSGDPNSINSEIIYKTWKVLNNSQRKKIFLISNFNLIKDQFKKLGYKIGVVKVENINNVINNNKIKILNIDLEYKDPFRVAHKYNSIFLKKSLEYAHRLSMSKEISGLINCPINKNLLEKRNIGLTEFFANKCKIKKNSEVMLIKNKKISVSPITTHINLKDVIKKINRKIIIEKIKTLHIWFKKYEKKIPKICLLGLNPHNAEFNKNSEEQKILLPIVKMLRQRGFKIDGPESADTIFVNKYKKYDVILGMYHDQVLAPFKALYKFDAINITLGLKYLRVSPDHGIASDLIFKKRLTQQV